VVASRDDLVEGPLDADVALGVGWWVGSCEAVIGRCREVLEEG
jgi:hypothetical protein